MVPMRHGLSGRRGWRSVGGPPVPSILEPTTIGLMVKQQRYQWQHSIPHHENARMASLGHWTSGRRGELCQHAVCKGHGETKGTVDNASHALFSADDVKPLSAADV